MPLIGIRYAIARIMPKIIKMSLDKQKSKPILCSEDKERIEIENSIAVIKRHQQALA